MNLGLYANIKKPQIREVLQKLCQWTRNREVTLFAVEALYHFLKLDEKALQVVSEKDFIRNSEMVLVMGGDGTMLAAARLMGNSGTPLLGVNMGGLGFLTEIAIEDLYKRLRAVLSGEYQVQRRMVLLADFVTYKQHHRLSALNDVVIHRGGTSRIVKIDVHVNHQYFNTYHADGIIVATPTGSTAYSLSCGGPILIPEMNGIILNPICPHTLTARPAVIPGNHQVTIRVLPTDNPASLTIDGQVNIALDTQTEITIKKADYYIHSVIFKNSSFFDVLRKKLQWGDIPRKQENESPAI